MISHCDPNMNPADLVQQANCVVACVRSLLSQDQPSGGYVQLEGDALFGLHLILDCVCDTLEAATAKL